MRGSPFFDGVTQVDAEIAGQAAKLPVFYHDASAMTALFPARYAELRRLMPDPRFVPARLAPGLGVLAVSCLEYYDTDIGPYNELAIAIPLNVPFYRANVPGRALVESLRRRQIHSYVLHLPVTTEVALRGGVDFYGFPKFLAGIEFDDDAGRRRCSLAEGQEPILRLSGERLRPDSRGEVQNFLHLWLDRQPQLAEFKQHQLDVGSTLRPGAAVLELERRHPIAQELDRLLVSRRSLQYEYVPRLEGILYGPEHLTLPLVRRLLAAAAERSAAT
jgi:Acetoacetate decarboxylase (ADC)